MHVVVAMPWRPGDPHRERSHKYVTEHLHAALPDAEVIDVDSGDPDFSRAASVNMAPECDVLVVHDADVVVPSPALQFAVELAEVIPRQVFPFRTYWSLEPEESTAQLVAPADVPVANIPRNEANLVHNSVGPVFAIRWDAWQTVGGMDPTFKSWGFEDVAFNISCSTLLGPGIRVPGEVLHLWHPSAMAQGSDRYKANAKRCVDYEQANGNPDLIRLLYAEAHG